MFMRNLSIVNLPDKCSFCDEPAITVISSCVDDWFLTLFDINLFCRKHYEIFKTMTKREKALILTGRIRFLL
jgi:hypothetical protein